ncbi:MAG: hypothetical protein LC107_10495 [Chitinophagales bacterium]|nr:hypothetical protein [Chitinophagales bacterium]
MKIHFVCPDPEWVQNGFSQLSSNYFSAAFRAEQNENKISTSDTTYTPLNLYTLKPLHSYYNSTNPTNPQINILQTQTAW